MIRRISVAGMVLASLLITVGCTVVRIHKYTVPAFVPPDRPHFIAGAGKADLTPPAGYPMGGYSFIAPISRGQWMQLMARAFFLRDAAGNTVVLVSCDLFAIPEGLHDRVAELLATEKPFLPIPPDHLIIAATHTHQGPGNYLTTSIYNQFASSAGGFDRPLFEFLAKQITAAVQNARTDAIESEAADHALAYREVTACEIARNRAIGPFGNDPDGADLFPLSGGCIPKVPDILRYRAIDPTLRILEIRRKVNGEWLLAGMLEMFSVHPTTMSHDIPVYSPDFTGYAMSLLEEKARAGGIGTPLMKGTPNFVAGFFNGAEGDVSPTWQVQDSSDLKRIADKLVGANFLVPPIKPHDTDDNPTLTVLSRDDAWKHLFADGFERPKFGDAALGGAEDGRAWFYASGCGANAGPDCGPNFGLASLGIPLSRWAHLAQSVDSFPKRVPVEVVRLGTLLTLVAEPFEMTSVNGLRLRTYVRPSEEGRKVAIIGLANEYISYMATSEEFDSKAYEGASTVFGKRSEFALHKLFTLAIGRSHSCSTCTVKSRTYFPGPKGSRFGSKRFTGMRSDSTEDLDHLFPDVTGRLDTRVVVAEWDETISDDLFTNLKRTFQVRADDNSTVVAHEGNIDLALIVRGRSAKYSLRYALVWQPPQVARRYKFLVHTSDKRDCQSDSFLYQPGDQGKAMTLTCSKTN